MTVRKATRHIDAALAKIDAVLSGNPPTFVDPLRVAANARAEDLSDHHQVVQRLGGEVAWETCWRCFSDSAELPDGTGLCRGCRLYLADVRDIDPLAAAASCYAIWVSALWRPTSRDGRTVDT